jgi:beta-lactam-binding protein with PASTA domain
MPATLTVSIPAETHSLAVDASGKGEATFIVTNSSAKPVQGRATVVPQEPARRDWFSIVGSQERNFRGGEAYQCKVEVAVPPDTPAGKYGFRLDAVNVANPDEDFAEGQTLSFEWKPVAVVAKPARPGWIVPAVIAACAALLLAIGLVFLLRDTRLTVPDVLGKSRTDAEAALNDAGIKLAQTPNFGFDAGKDLDTVLELSAMQDGKSDKLGPGGQVSKAAEVTLTLNKYSVVPKDVIGKTRDEAEKNLTAAQLKVAKEPRLVDDPSKDPTLVSDTVPKPGEKMRPDTEIVLVFSNFPVVPKDVIGKTRDVAEQLLKGAFLRAAKEPRRVDDPSKDPTLVLDTVPKPGEKTAPNTEVVLVFSNAVTMPNLVGMNIEEARKKLKDFGFKVEAERQRIDKNKGRDTVLEMGKVSAGQRVSPGAGVVLTINRYATVPSILGLDLKRAKDEIAKAGLRVAATVKQKLDKSKTAATVLEVEPKPSEIVAPNHEVTLTANQGLFQVTCQAAYVATFETHYTLKGKNESHGSGDIPVGQTREVTIPLDATDVRIKILYYTGLFKETGTLLEKKFDGPVTMRYRAKGDIINHSVEEN